MLHVTGLSADQKTPSNDKFGVAAPQIVLPKGDGALHGIGEKFLKNLSSLAALVTGRQQFAKHNFRIGSGLYSTTFNTTCSKPDCPNKRRK